MKTMIIRFLNGFCYAVAITVIVQLVIMAITNSASMLPEYMDRFDSPAVAYAVQLLLIGFISGVASAGGIIMEWKRPGLIVQSILFLTLLLVTWIPVACFLWSFHKYTSSMVSGILSILVTYIICWTVEYKLCVRDIREINERLKEKGEHNDEV